MVVGSPFSSSLKFGSLNPEFVLPNSAGRPGNVPNITGSWQLSPSLKYPITHVPSTIKEGEDPRPDIPAEVVGSITEAQGKSAVGNLALSCV